MYVNLTFDGHRLRMFGSPDRPEWVAKDVCRVLAVHHSADALRNAGVLPDERGSIRVDTPGGPQTVTTVTEPGLWKLVLISRKPAAQRFKQWLAVDVLPCIRKHGCYPAPAAPTAESLAVVDLDSPAQLRELLEALSRRRLADKALIEEQQSTIVQLAPKAEVFDQCMASDDLLTIQVVAKILNRPTRPCGELRLFSFLRSVGVLQANNQPYQRFIDEGLFAIAEVPWKDKDGKPHVYAQTRVTQKGLAYIHRRLDAEIGQRSLLPLRAVRPTPRELS